MEAASPVFWNAVTTPKVAICTPPRKTLYPVTPTLSVAAVQERLICEEDTAVAVNPVGVDGAVVSPTGACVVALADEDGEEMFPAASRARTV